MPHEACRGKCGVESRSQPVECLRSRVNVWAGGAAWGDSGSVIGRWCRVRKFSELSWSEADTVGACGRGSADRQFVDAAGAPTESPFVCASVPTHFLLSQLFLGGRSSPDAARRQHSAQSGRRGKSARLTPPVRRFSGAALLSHDDPLVHDACSALPGPLMAGGFPLVRHGSGVRHGHAAAHARGVSARGVAGTAVICT